MYIQLSWLSFTCSWMIADLLRWQLIVEEDRLEREAFLPVSRFLPVTRFIVCCVGN